MARCVALLGGLNVGRHHRVAMADLRAAFEELGHRDVATALNSGNVVFTAHGPPSRLASSIQATLTERFGFAIPTFVRTERQVRGLLADPPWPDADGATILVGFLTKAPPAAGKRAVAEASTDVDRLHLAGADLWWRIEGTALSTQLKDRDLRPVGPMTTRNITALRTIAAKL